MSAMINKYISAEQIGFPYSDTLVFSEILDYPFNFFIWIWTWFASNTLDRIGLSVILVTLLLM